VTLPAHDQVSSSPDVRRLQVRAQDLVAGGGDAPEIRPGEIKVHFTRLIELVAVQIVPIEGGLRGGIPVEGVRVGVAEHVVIQAKCRFHDRFASEIPGDAGSRHRAGELLHLNLLEGAGREYGRPIARRGNPAPGSNECCRSQRIPRLIVRLLVARQLSFRDTA